MNCDLTLASSMDIALGAKNEPPHFEPFKCCINAIFLPRQARDKHGGKVEKRGMIRWLVVFRRTWCVCVGDWGARELVKHGLFALPFIYENEHFTKTGSGQT